MDDKVEKLIERSLKGYNSESVLSGAFELWDTACLISGGCLIGPYGLYYDQRNHQYDFSFSNGYTLLFVASCPTKKGQIKVVRSDNDEEITVKLLKGEPGSKSKQIADIIFDGFIEGQDGK